MKQNSLVAKSREAKQPKIDVTFKEYISGVIKMSFFNLSQDPGAAKHCVAFEKILSKSGSV